MSRTVRVAAGQLGPIQRDHSRADVVERLIALLHRAVDAGCDLIVYPELALTTFFPRWYVADITTTDHWYETEMPNESTQPLFDEAARLGVGFCLGYALLDTTPDGIRHRWNVMTLVERDGRPVGWLGELHPSLVRKLQLHATPLVFELELEATLAAAVTAYQDISRFPAVRRDLAIVVDENVAVADLENSVRDAAGRTLLGASRSLKVTGRVAFTLADGKARPGARPSRSNTDRSE